MYKKQIIVSSTIFITMFTSAFLFNAATKKEYLDQETIENLVEQYGEIMNSHPLRPFDSREYVRLNKAVEEFELSIE
ncbi:hypothetical protein [Priestia endophytica]|jgi:hypothetical protein|uniref:Uncharacterized protein n=1 Tax=Priestia endophytica TaxID=135735 RepID=A0AAX1Q577_9BACI|nr:hypothetical protein [Priestia endophytica]RAS74661.1 hypothetical protein A3864_17100 [Priestia endophytica]RAS88074.1 hypothetical protein A3863_16090 [Priestia endophytica]